MREGERGGGIDTNVNSDCLIPRPILQNFNRFSLEENSFSLPKLGREEVKVKRENEGCGNGVEMIDPFPGGNWRKEEEEKKEEEFVDDESVRRRRAIGRGAPSG